jgi:hypothetical protein
VPNQFQRSIIFMKQSMTVAFCITSLSLVLTFQAMESIKPKKNPPSHEITLQFGTRKGYRLNQQVPISADLINHCHDLRINPGTNTVVVDMLKTTPRRILTMIPLLQKVHSIKSTTSQEQADAFTNELIQFIHRIKLTDKNMFQMQQRQAKLLNVPLLKLLYKYSKEDRLVGWLQGNPLLRTAHLDLRGKTRLHAIHPNSRSASLSYNSDGCCYQTIFNFLPKDDEKILPFLEDGYNPTTPAQSQYTSDGTYLVMHDYGNASLTKHSGLPERECVWEPFGNQMLWHLKEKTPHQIIRFEHGDGPITDYTCNTDATAFTAIFETGRIIVKKVSGEEQITEGIVQRGSNTKFSHNGQFFVAQENNSLHIFDTASLSKRVTLKTPYSSAPASFIFDSDKWYDQIVKSHLLVDSNANDTLLVAVDRKEGSIDTYTTGTWEKTWNITSELFKDITHIALHPNAPLIAITLTSGVVQIWRLSDGSHLGTIEPQLEKPFKKDTYRHRLIKGMFYSSLFTPDGSKLLLNQIIQSPGSIGTIHVVDCSHLS